MGREAEPRHHGATDGEGDLLQGGEEDGTGVGSSPRRQEEDARVSSSRSHSAVASDASFRSSESWSSSSFSSLASNVESDDGDAAYPWTQCEYEEIPSFRWIVSPLRWWKTKKGRALTTIRDEEPRTPAGSRASETYPGLVHLEGYLKFRLDQLLWGNADVLGENIYWSTYKATLRNVSPLVVRKLRSEVTKETAVVVRKLRSEVTKDFVTQVNLIGKIRHSNLLAPRAYYYGTNPEVAKPLIMFVDELDYMRSLSDFIDVKFLQKFLVFDYMPRGSLSKFLHARGNSSPIDWPTRMNIAIGVARGLHHLHTQGNMVHGNLSSVNVLLDYHVNAKIGGYGISKLLNPDAANSYFNFEGTTRTYEYRAPELSNLNKANTKTDVYSLGMIMLELLTMKSPTYFLDRTQRVASIAKQYTSNIPEYLDTLKLALKCVDASPNVRPEMRKVLQQLKEIKSKFEKTTHTPTDAAAASNITRASPATGDQQKRPFPSSERTTSPFKDNGIRTPRTSNNFANDGNLPQACASENTIYSPLASSASDVEAMPAPIDSCKHKVENLSKMTPQGDLKDYVIPNPSQAEEITQNPLDVLNPAEDRMDMERCNGMSQGTGASPLSGIDWATGRSVVKSAGGATAGTSPSTTAAAIPTTGSWLGTKSSFLSHSVASSSFFFYFFFFPACVLMYCSIYPAFLSLYRSSTQTEEFTSAESVDPDEVTNSPTSQLEGEEAITYELSGQDRSAESKRRSDGLTDHDMSSGGAGIINPLSNIDWSKLENMEVELQVPSASPPISNEPDLIYQSSFLSHSVASSSSSFFYFFFFPACVLMYCSIYPAFLSLYRSSTQTEEFASAESVAPDEVTNSPTSQLEGDQDAITYELSGQDHRSAESRRTYRLTNHMSSGSGAGIMNPLSSIDWSKLENMEVELLQVPSASPLISSKPDLIFQSYFLTLHKLGHTSPPLPFDLLEGHVNRMVVGLHSMGYPLDAWTKAATLLLVSAKKREYIERYVEDYKAQLEVQDQEFTSAITLAKENFSRIQSNLSALEQTNQELDETIAGLLLEQEKVVNELTAARDLLATAEAEAESISIDMDRVKQQRSATSLLRDEMLQQLPPLDEVFDSAFQEIMDKKF